MSPAAPFLGKLIGYRGDSSNPNISDSENAASVRIAQHILEMLGLGGNTSAPESQSAGTLMEKLVAADLRSQLGALAPDRRWTVDHPGLKLSRFAQYAHLAQLQRIIDNDETKVLGTAIGRDYEVAPDVTVGLRLPEGADDVGVGDDSLPLLHATVSCKLTIRSDRVQNIRQESAVLIRQRRGRLPHIVAVTAEPLPTRIASIARGTGDVDAVYHPAFEELVAAVAAEKRSNQRDTLDELIGQRRLLDYADLARTIAVS